MTDSTETDKKTDARQGGRCGMSEVTNGIIVAYIIIYTIVTVFDLNHDKENREMLLKLQTAVNTIEVKQASIDSKIEMIDVNEKYLRDENHDVNKSVMQMRNDIDRLQSDIRRLSRP